MKIWQLKDSRSYNLITLKQNDTSEPSEVVNVSIALPIDNGIKVKLSKLSITSTDVSAYLGKFNKFPIVPARSALAHVSESSIDSYKTGQRVYLSPYSDCRNGTFKLRSVDIDGYLADYCYLPISDVYTLPDDINDDEAVFIEDIALAVKVLETISVEKAEYIALYGASHINLIIAQLAIYYQTVPVVIDDDEDRLNIAQNLGIYYTINLHEEVLSQKVIEITSGKLFDHLIFDSDSFKNIDDLLIQIKHGGKAAIVGYNPFIEPIQCNLAVVTARELKIYGVNNGFGEIPTAINMLANEIVKIKGLVEHRGDFNNYNEFIKNISDRNNYGKAIIEC